MSAAQADMSLKPSSPRRAVLRWARHRGTLIAIAAFLVCLGLIRLVSGSLNYYDISTIATGGATLATAAIGQTVVVLSGGFDLSAAAVISLVNVTLASHMQDDPSSILLWSCAGIAIGAAAGAFNGFFIAFLRLQPIVVTLATMFILQGVTLLVMDKPGGQLPAGFSAFFTADVIPDWLPGPVLMLVLLVLGWLLLKNTIFGKAISPFGGQMGAATHPRGENRDGERCPPIQAGGAGPDALHRQGLQELLGALVAYHLPSSLVCVADRSVWRVWCVGGH